MKEIVITSDSRMCPLKKEDTIIIPAQIVCSNGNSFKDDGKISNKKILDDMQYGLTYKTSSPLLGEFENTFRQILEQRKDIIHLSMSSGISKGSVNGANVIANDLNEEYNNKVYVIDSLTGAVGGTLFYELAYQELINSNLTTKELVYKLNKLKNNISTSFYAPDIDGYIKSGRDKTKSHLKEGVLFTASKVAKIGSFKFRVDFHKNGDLFLKKVFRSPQNIGMIKMVNEIVNEKNIEQFDDSCVVVGNLHKEKVNMEDIKNYLKDLKYFKKIIEQDIGSVVAAYGCSDLCGIALMKKLQM